MIQRVEKQRQVTQNPTVSREVAVAVSRINNAPEDFEVGANNAFVRNSFKGRRENNRRRDNSAKNALFFYHCQRNGHTRDKCFKLVGYPDWYEGLRDNTKSRKPPVRLAAAVQNAKLVLDTPLEETDNTVMTIGQPHTDPNGNILQALAQEMLKLMKGKTACRVNRSCPGFLCSIYRYNFL